MRSGQTDIAVAGRHVEHFLSRPKIEGLAELFADDLQRRPNNGIVARGPGHLLPVLQCREIGCCGGRSLVRRDVLR